MTTPIVSIIVPIYNGAPFIKQAIDCIINQTFSDYELIVIDDGSTDDSYNVIKEYTKDIKNKVIIKKNNEGVSRARNTGLDIATGEYIAFLDIDDIWYKSKLQMQVNILENNKEIGLICSAKTINGFFSGKYKNDQCRNFTSTLINKGNFITTSSVLIRRNILQKNNLRFSPNLKLGEDWLLWIQLSEYVDFYYLSEPLISYKYSPYQKYPIQFYHQFYLTLKKEIKESKYLEKHTDKLLLLSNLTYYSALLSIKQKPIKSLILIFFSIMLNPLSIKRIINHIRNL